MALLMPNHTATIYELIETPRPGDKVVPIPAEAVGEEIACLIEPLGADVIAVDSRNQEIVLINPYRIMSEPEDVEKLKYGARVVWEDTGAQFRLTRRGSLQNGGGALAILAYGVAEMELLEVTDDAAGFLNPVDHE